MSDDARRKEPIMYHSDTISIVPYIATYNVCYSWQELLEEPTNKEIFPDVKESMSA